MNPFGMILQYRWHMGMVLWLGHRLSGLGLALYLVLHIYSNYHLLHAAREAVAAEKAGATPEAAMAIWNETYAIYNNAPAGVMEILLLAAVLFHSFNGLRILAVDFLGGARYHQKLNYAMWAAFFATFLPLAALMMVRVLSHLSH